VTGAADATDAMAAVDLAAREPKQAGVLASARL
jgi:hypothetical protein